MNRHRSFSFPRVGPTVGYDEAGIALREPPEHLRAMDRRELTRLYRNKARETLTPAATTKASSSSPTPTRG